MLAPRAWRSCELANGDPAWELGSLQTSPKTDTHLEESTTTEVFSACNFWQRSRVTVPRLSRAQMKKGMIAQHSVCWDIHGDELLQRPAFLISYSDGRSGPEPFLSSQGWRRGSLPSRENKVKGQFFGTQKSKFLWLILNGSFSSPPARSTRGFFSKIYYENMVKLLEINLQYCEGPPINIFLFSVNY